MFRKTKDKVKKWGGKIRKKTDPYFMEEAERDGEGRAIIDMAVYDDRAFLSGISDISSPNISGEVADYLEDMLDGYSPNEQVCLRIETATVTTDKAAMYSRALRHHYSRKYAESRRSYNRAMASVAVLLFFGIVLMAIEVWLTYEGLPEVWQQVLYIFAWVLISEAATVYFLRCTSIRSRQKRYKSLMDTKVVFVRAKPGTPLSPRTDQMTRAAPAPHKAAQGTQQAGKGK